MEKQRAFLFTDIHGCDKALQDILKFWNGKDLLVCMGDCIDRGPDNFKTILRMIFLRKMLGDRLVYIRGNHEDMFSEFFEWQPDEMHAIPIFLNNGGLETMYDIYQGLGLEAKGRDFDEFLKSATHGYGYMGDLLPEVEMLLEGMVSHHIFGKALITHAGFQSLKEDWTKTSKSEFCWVRDHYKHPNKTGMINFFGHTPTSLISKDCPNGEVWTSKCGTYVGLDGGGVFKGGQHNAVLIDEDGNIIQKYFVRKA